jgi:hypothetical protein
LKDLLLEDIELCLVLRRDVGAEELFRYPGGLTHDTAPDLVADVLDVKQREQLTNFCLLGGVVGVKGGGNTKREDEKKSGTLHGRPLGRGMGKAA